MLHVTKTYLPPRKKFIKQLNTIWESHILTNNGLLVRELENKLKKYTQCKNVLVCANGTVVLQMALKAMNITKDVITTPFSYVATVNAVLWERCTPVFVDINKNTFTIDVNKIEAAITENTQAILATHVYGYPCDVEKIEKIALKYNLKVIYDAANAFGTTYKGKSIFTFGDISTCSFHATKLFHSAEGGALFINDEKYVKQLSLYRSFGHVNDDYYSVGINAKMSELHAAMALCVFDDLKKIIAKRKKVFLWYDRHLIHKINFKLSKAKLTGHNYAYYPVLFINEKELMKAVKVLRQNDIFPRRYFFPSLNQLPFLMNTNSCPVSESISKRILCLPLSYYITDKEVKKIAGIINKFKIK